MNRPARARSSGSASVMSSPLKVMALGHLEPGVAHDRVGQRRLAGAVGAHQGVDLALGDGQVDALEDLLLAGADVQVANFEVRHGRSTSPSSSSGGDRRGGRSAGPANSTSSARVVPFSARTMPPWTRVHSSLVAQPLAVVGLVRAQHARGPVVREALHRRDRPLEREHDLVHGDRRRRDGPARSRRGRRGSRSTRPAFLQLGDDVLEVGERQALGSAIDVERASARRRRAGRARPSGARRTRLWSRRSSRLILAPRSEWRTGADGAARPRCLVQPCWLSFAEIVLLLPAAQPDLDDVWA